VVVKQTGGGGGGGRRGTQGLREAPTGTNRTVNQSLKGSHNAKDSDDTRKNNERNLRTHKSGYLGAGKGTERINQKKVSAT